MVTPKATRTLISDLNPKAQDWMQRAIDEHSRRHGRIRELVLRMLAAQIPEEWQPEANGVFQSRAVRIPRRQTEPTRDDLAAALLEAPGEPIPPALLDYAAKVIREESCKPGPKTPRRSTWEDVAIIAYYQRALQHFCDAHEADGTPATRNVKTRAKAATAKAFDLKPRTIENLIAPRPLLKPPPK